METNVFLTLKNAIFQAPLTMSLYRYVIKKEIINVNCLTQIV